MTVSEGLPNPDAAPRPDATNGHAHHRTSNPDAAPRPDATNGHAHHRTSDAVGVVPWSQANSTYLQAELSRLRVRAAMFARKRGRGGDVITEGELRERLAARARDAHESRARLSAAGEPAALETLAELFELEPFEKDVLLLALASELDPSFEDVFASLQEDARKRRPTTRLCLALAEDDAGAWVNGREYFAPEAPLRRHQLVVFDAGTEPALERGLSVDRRVADYLAGVDGVDERLVRILRPLEAGPVAQLPARLSSWCRAVLEGRPTPRVLNLHGPAESGARALVRALGRELGLSAYDVRLRAVASASGRVELACLIEREAVLSGLLLFIDASEVAPDTEPWGFVDQLLDSRVPLVLSTAAPWAAERELVECAVSPPESTERARHWGAALGPAAASRGEIVERLAAQFEFGPDTIWNVVRSVRAEAGASVERDGPPDTALWAAALARARRSLTDLGQRLSSSWQLEDLVLPPELVATLGEIAAQVRHRATVLDTWGFSGRTRRGRGTSVLFSGPSGTGKTMAAEVLANQLELDLYRVDLSQVVDKYIGETEKRLRRVFDAAEQSGSVLFFDEADALFGQRTEVRDSHDRYANIEVSYLLQRMEDYRGLAILATNLKGHLDPAFLRRLRFVLDFPFPSPAARELLWRKAFPPAAPTEVLDYARLARLELAGGNIRNVSINAAYLAAEEREPIGMRHVLAAARREYVKIDKLTIGSELELSKGERRG
jgi:hypothetical protein